MVVILLSKSEQLLQTFKIQLLFLFDINLSSFELPLKFLYVLFELLNFRNNCCVANRYLLRMPFLKFKLFAQNMKLVLKLLVHFQ